MIDLHIHSTISDGDYSPEELVDMAKKSNIKVLAVSDHDTLEGSRRAIQRGKEVGLEVISAVEISASFNGNVLHILGYYLDLDNKLLQDTLKKICEYRVDRAKRMVANINKELSIEGKKLLDIDVLLKKSAEKPLTRSDIAQYLLTLGYVQTKQEAFERWLTKYNMANKELTVAGAIEIIHNAGGIAVLAHPLSEHLSLSAITKNLDEQKMILADFKRQGLDGVEVFRFKHTPEEQQHYLELSKSLNLIPTGGSDYHGPNHIEGVYKLGLVVVPDDVVNTMREYVDKHRK